MPHQTHPTARRIRRKPEDAEQEIFEAARAFLEQNDFRDLTVRKLMQLTGMQRSAFYSYFEDRYAVVVGLMQQLEVEFAESSRVWFDASEDLEMSLARALEAGARVWARQGAVLRALHEASYHDHEIQRYYREGLVQGFIDGVERKLRAENEAGRATVPSPKSIAEGLVLLNIQVYLERIACAPGAEDPREVAETVQYIWIQAIYPGAWNRLATGCR